MKLIAIRIDASPVASRWASISPARARISRTMNVSSSTDRPVSIAAWTIALIDWGSIGMLGRKRHSYSCSRPVASSTIGWNATWWTLRRLKK